MSDLFFTFEGGSLPRPGIWKYTNKDIRVSQWLQDSFGELSLDPADSQKEILDNVWTSFHQSTPTAYTSGRHYVHLGTPATATRTEDFETDKNIKKIYSNNDHENREPYINRHIKTYLNNDVLKKK